MFLAPDSAFTQLREAADYVIARTLQRQHTHFIRDRPLLFPLKEERGIHGDSHSVLRRELIIFSKIISADVFLVWG